MSDAGIVVTAVFDLDGTLIDSSSGILSALAAAFTSCGVKPVRPLVSQVIGPPLLEMLSLLSGSSDAALIDRLAEKFKYHYPLCQDRSRLSSEHLC